MKDIAAAGLRPVVVMITPVSRAIHPVVVEGGGVVGGEQEAEKEKEAATQGRSSAERRREAVKTFHGETILIE